jgi:bacterioferritin (cytochrome b1)
MTSSLVGASVWEEDLYAHLTEHATDEQATIERYRDLAGEAESATFRYLVDLIVEDEIRHHRWMADLAATVRSASDLSDPPLPTLDLDRAGGEVVAATEELLRIERADRKALKALERKLDDVRDTTIWALIVHLMLIETDKHIAVLEFVRRHAGRR